MQTAPRPAPPEAPGDPAAEKRCRACRHDLGKTMVVVDEWTVFACPNCGSGTLAPTPDPDVLSAAYEEGVYAKERSARVVPVLSGVLDRLNERRVRFAFGTDGTGRRLLDVGSGKGRLLQAAKRLGYDVTGVEPHGNRSSYAITEYGVPVFQGPLEEFPAADAGFDVITIWHVIEHVPDPVDFVARTKSLLAPGGRLAIEVPCVRTASRSLTGSFWQGWQLPYHLSHFTPQGITTVLEAAGYRVVELSTWSAELNPFMWVISLVDLISGGDQILHRVLKRNWTPRSRSDWALLARTVVGTAAVGVLLPFIWLAARAEAALGRGAIVRVIAEVA